MPQARRAASVTRSRHTSAAPELRHSLVTPRAKAAQHGVDVDTQRSGKVTRRRQPVTGAALTLGDGTPDRACHLLVQGVRVRDEGPARRVSARRAGLTFAR